MRHTVIQRVALALCGLLVTAALLFAWRAARAREAAPDPTGERSRAGADGGRGRADFVRRCASCHDPEDLLPPLREAEDRGLAAVAMLEFLARHGKSSAEEDRSVVAYLLATETESR